jgi:RHS repeat-associated protein
MSSTKKNKPAGRPFPAKQGRRGFALMLGSTAALAVVVALGASARNGLLQESAVKAASDRFESQIHGYGAPAMSSASTPVGKSTDDHAVKASKVPIVAAPHGIDAGNKCIAQTAGGGGSSGGGAIYDPLRRIVKIVETRGGSVTSTKQFIWAGDQLAEERDASGNVTKRFFDLGEQISGTNYYYTRDHNDSVHEMTDSTGAVQSEFSYDPYGRPTQIAGSGPVPDFGYAGMYVHSPSSLNLAVDRAYNPSLGRWMSRDPIDDPTFGFGPREPEPRDPGAILMSSSFGYGPAMAAPPNPKMMTIKMVSQNPMIQSQLASAMQSSPQANPYTYVANNPINRRDPSGLAPHVPGVPSPDVTDCVGLCSHNLVHPKGVSNTTCDKLFGKCVKECLDNPSVLFHM